MNWMKWGPSQSPKWRPKLALATSLMLLSPLSQAALHKCVDASGATRYSDVPCAEAAEAESQPMPGALLSAIAEEAEPLTGIHSSWLQTPAYADTEVECRGSKCYCGETSFRQPSKKPEERLLKAMEALPKLWDDYQNNVDELRLQSWSGREVSATHRVRRVSCELRMNQQFLRELHDDLVAPLLHAQSQSVQQLRKKRGQCQRPSGEQTNSGDAWLAYERCENEGLEETTRAHSTLTASAYSAQRLQRALDTLAQPRPSWVQ